jgi:hypothetical protein
MSHHPSIQRSHTWLLLLLLEIRPLPCSVLFYVTAAVAGNSNK